MGEVWVDNWDGKIFLFNFFLQNGLKCVNMQHVSDQEEDKKNILKKCEKWTRKDRTPPSLHSGLTPIHQSSGNLRIKTDNPEYACLE